MSKKIVERIEEYASFDMTALSMGDENVSYRELCRITDLMAGIIRGKVQSRQVPVVIYMKRSILFVEYMLAVLKSGCYYIPVEETVPPERVRYILEDIGAKLVIVDEITCEKLRETQFYCQYVLKAEEIEVGGEKSEAKKANLIPSQEEELAYVMYTSGTSGKPKGVKIKCANLQNLVDSFEEILYKNLSHKVNVGVVASFSFDSSVKQIYSALYYGHCLCIADSSVKYFGQKLISFFEKNDLSVSDLTPSHLKLLNMQNKYDTCYVKYLVVGGEKLRYEVLLRLLDKMKSIPTVINVYGPTECCVDVAYDIVTEDDIRSKKKGDVPIGRAIKNTTLFLRDESEKIINEVEKTGELCIAGKQVGAGYVNVTNLAFVEGEYGNEYRTGDMAYFDRDGKVVVIGRKDKQIKINGNRVEPEEISCTVENILGCQCCVALGKSKGKDVLIAYLIRDELTKEEVKILNDSLRRKLNAYMIPGMYICDKTIPLTGNGKIDEKYIQEYMENNDRRVDY